MTLEPPPVAPEGVFFRLDSPCTRQCRLDPVTRVCVGCGRTRLEIAHWSRMTDAERQAVWKRLIGVSNTT